MGSNDATGAARKSKRGGANRERKTKTHHDGGRASSSKSLSKALTLLRVVAAHDLDGARLTELSKDAGLPIATAHRLLATLEKEEMVVFDLESKRYNLGLGSITLGETSKILAIKSVFRAALERISEIIEENVYLTVAIGYDGLIVDHVECLKPYRLIAPLCGSRRPLGVGASGIALLAAYGRKRAKEIFAINEPRYGEYDWIDAARIMKQLNATWRCGYAVVEGQIFKEATAISVAFMGNGEDPVASIGVAAINSRLLPDRRTEIIGVINGELSKISLTRAISRKLTGTMKASVWDKISK